MVVILFQKCLKIFLINSKVIPSLKKHEVNIYILFYDFNKDL